METRPATADDFVTIADIYQRWETSWFGEVESSTDELREGFDRVESLADNTLLVVDGERIVGAGIRWRTDSAALVDPDVDAGESYALLLDWLAAGSPAYVQALSRDDAFRAVLESAGWRHAKSSFDMLRQVTPDLVLGEPRWPDGITVRGFGLDDAAAVHHLIYVDAAWADVPGHPNRDFDEWRSIFVTEHTLPEQQVLAFRGQRLVGVSMGRTWDDGTGWVSQLATARDERGKGLGRAMLLEALRRRRDAGANALGLGVQAENRGALQMYLDAGLEIDREWMEYVPG